MAQVVAVTTLLEVASAGDRVHGDPALRELVHGGEHPRGQRRRHEAGPVGHEQPEALGVGGRVRGDLGAFRPAGAVAHQDAVEAAVFMGLGEPAGVVRVDRRPGADSGLRRVAGADHADELDVAELVGGPGVGGGGRHGVGAVVGGGHGVSLSGLVRRGAGRVPSDRLR